MATVKLIKRNQFKASVKKAAAGAPFKADDFVISDNEDSTCTVWGTDGAGHLVDISAVATLSPPPTSSDTSKITVDAPSGMTFAMHALAVTDPGQSVMIEATATWNDGSVGPFIFDLPCTVQHGPVTGITIVPGTPTVRS